MRHHLERLGSTQDGVEAIFSARIDQLRSPWSTYAVFDRSGLIFGNGLTGVPADGRPSVDTAFRIASCTKSFTAAAALLLRDAGRLSLDDPIDKFVRLGGPEGAGGRLPTVGQLLSMNGGLPTDDPWADRQESMSIADFDRLAGNGFRFVRRPGTGYEYSNLGFALVGRAIAVAAGRPYVDFVTDELLRPLGLDQIAYHAGVPAADGVAVGYHRTGGGPEPAEWVAQPFSGPGAFSPIGGLFATPRALVDWVRWLGDPADERVLSAASRREMGTVHTPIGEDDDDGNGYGYGLVVEESPRHGTVLAHSGGYPGFGAHLRWHSESGIGIVAMENATYCGTKLAARAALTLMLDETAMPERAPELWPETIAARDTVERLLRHWDPELAGALFADNVELDEPLSRRAASIGELVRAAGIAATDPVPLLSASPFCNSPAHLVWTSPGSSGSLRCEIQLTPQSPPLVQTLTVRLG
ncbi:serine hydrolase domain-containing protein [Nakamurella lactea]|uniref:serine hydrolase domain-containing protein n=1 Tax=Nakamurella lactea TaxID=459515 RepID=UPI00040735A2|nr:serine hydrolase domain-containing protein [Nakamurella lactea]